MIAGGAGKVRMAEGTDFEFKPVKTWLGRQATEKVDGWEAEARAGGRAGVQRVWGGGRRSEVVNCVWWWWWWWGGGGGGGGGADAVAAQTAALQVPAVRGQ